ncbi:MAG: GNAT family N-acetyltransferase [Pirellulales bacterium]|nr:GNAT family N-acetyltransferase [Pirellulales bacterium]
MRVFCLFEIEELEPYAADWDRLSRSVPFRSWTWLSTWWRHYGPQRHGVQHAWRLFVPCVFDHTDRLIGIAPWYVDSGGPQGRVLRMLGSGEICSDYLSVLCQPGTEYAVTQLLCECLVRDERVETYDTLPWDLLELSGCDAEDVAIGHLLQHLDERGYTIHRRVGPNCWRVELPDSWDAYLASLSKSHRSQLRRLQRKMFDNGRTVLHSVERAEELPRAIDLLVELHQRRRRVLGEPGCFASAPFEAFHREVMPKILLAGQLHFHWLELDGKPVAVEYGLAGGGVVYAYQSGIDPEAMDRQPGRLIIMATLKKAIEEGYRAFDFLRGDEPYKPHFRAQPRPSLEARVVPNRPAAQLRHHLWLAGSHVKHWFKSGLRLAGAREG